jgi:hypothetical protein
LKIRAEISAGANTSGSNLVPERYPVLQHLGPTRQVTLGSRMPGNGTLFPGPRADVPKLPECHTQPNYTTTA